METAESLGLEGKNVSITITKVGGEEQEMKTKEFKVQETSPRNKEVSSQRPLEFRGSAMM